MRAAQKIANQMVELVGEKGTGWEIVPSFAPTIRYTATHPTPEYAREGDRPLWEGETYNTHVFVTLVNGMVVLGTSTAPWVGRRDRDIPFWLAELILAEPALALDTHRQLKLKAARKAAAGGRPR